MDYRRHAVVNTVLGSLALKVAALPIVVKTLSPAVLAGFLIDADHFLYQMWKQRTLSPRKALRGVIEDWEEKKYRFYLFHTLEFGVVFTIVVYYSSLTWPWAFGYWIHLSSDIYYNYRLRRNIYWLSKWIGMLQGWRLVKRKRRARRVV